MRQMMTCFAALLSIATFGARQVSAQGSPAAPALMTVTVDETQAARRLASVHEEIPVRPGPLALAYPKWIPGEHGPTGPLAQAAVLQLHAGTIVLPWTRDADDIYTVHVDVPDGAAHISVDFDVLLQHTISDHQLLLTWNTAIWYPLGIDKRTLIIEPAIRLPFGWTHSSSLTVVSRREDRVTFAPTSLERLIDSPVLAGEFLRVVPLTATWPAELAMTADNQVTLDKVGESHAYARFGALIDEDRAMFGFRHWDKMHFLVSQSDARPYDGLEHQDAPYTATMSDGLWKADELERWGGPLFAHEQSHSWIGKYRRAAEMYAKPDYQGPERTSLLWVYEGLNQYVGFVLATRAGFSDAGYLHDTFANWAAWLAYEPARRVVPLVDTATENWILRTVDGSWTSLRRSQDYYNEGALMWLAADAIIRRGTNGGRSLDDFLRLFFGQSDTGPIVATYTRADVEKGLATVFPHDWHMFIERHVYQVNGAPPVDGLEGAGWRLIYNATPNRDRFLSPEYQPAGFQPYSIGAIVKSDGTIAEVLPGSPAFEAGLGPKMTILSVNGVAFSIDSLTSAIANRSRVTMSIVARNFDTISSHEVHYSGGLRYPHLERIDGTRDYLADIVAARRDP